MSVLRAAAQRVTASPFAIGCVSLSVFLLVLVGGFSGRLNTLFSGTGHTRTIQAVFADTQQLKKGDEVRVHGVKVGNVDAIQLQPGARAAAVSMKVGDSVGTLHSNARAQVRWKLVLGGAFYVAIDPGTGSGAELPGPTIPQSQTSGQVEIEDLLKISRGGAAKGLQTMPGQLAEALSNRSAPAQTFQALNRVSPDLTHGLKAVRGQVPDTDLQTLVKATAHTVASLDSPAEKLRGLVSGAAVLLATTGGREAEVRQMLQQTPGVLRNTSLTTAGLDRTLALADPLLSKLRGPAGEVAPTLQKLRPTVVQADQLLRDARPLLDSLRPAVASLADTAQQGSPLLDTLSPSLTRLDSTVLPYLNEVDPQTKHTTAQMIGPNFSGFGGAAGQEDAKSHLIRFPATVGSSNFYLPCQIYANNPDKAKLAECKSLQQLFGTYLNYNPLGPAPGTAPGPDGRTIR